MTVKLRDIYDAIDAVAPYDTQFDWDNSGIAVGSPDAEVSKVLISLDCTNAAVKGAVENGCDAILTHHPLLFRPAKAVLEGTPLYAAVRAGLSVLSAHTNFDMAVGGINDLLAASLELKNAEPFFVEGRPMLRMGTLDKPMTSDEFTSYVSDRLGCSVSFTDAAGLIRTVAVCGGSGGEYAREVRLGGADAFVTGEAKHNQLYEAVDCGLCMVVAGHYETEICAVDAFDRILAKAFPELETVQYYQPPTQTLAYNYGS